MFDALLGMPSLAALNSESMHRVQELRYFGEQGLAFEVLAGAISNQDIDLSDDAWALMKLVGERLRLEPKEWHGLKEKMEDSR